MTTGTGNGATGKADQDLVEEVAATLELPRGAVDAAAIDRWSEGLAARGWSPDDSGSTHLTDPAHHHYRLRHAASGCRVDVLVLPNDPADPRYLTVGDVEDDGQLRYTFSTVRLFGPEGSGLLADANLTDAQPNGAVAWRLSRAARAADGSTQAGTTHTATANPFQRRFRLPGWPGVSIPTPVLAVALGLAALVLLGAVGWWWRAEKPS